jgi:hypothetical protein
MGATIAEGDVNLVTGKVSNSLAWNAKHKDGVPRDCVAVEANFLDGNLSADQGGDPDGPGMKDADTSLGPYVNPENGDNEFGLTQYVDGGNVLKVSWFIRDSSTGVEFGDDAYHLENFSDSTTWTMTSWTFLAEPG